MVELKFKKLHPDAILPTRGTPLSAGLDLYAIEDTLIIAGDWRLVPTGLAIEFPPSVESPLGGWEAQIRSRSGLALKQGITVLNAPATIDQDYSGPIGVILKNNHTRDTYWTPSHDPGSYYVHKGDRIAQLILAPVFTDGYLEVVEVTEIKENERGSRGFGSTGA